MEYARNFTFTTLKGAGHLAPRSSPALAAAMFERFISNEAL